MTSGPKWVQMVCEVCDQQDPMHDMSAYEWDPEVPNVMYIWDRSAMIVEHRNTHAVFAKEGDIVPVYTMSGLWPGPNTHIVVRNADIKEVCLALKAAYMINREV